VKLLTCLAILLLATGAGSAVPSNPYRTIERWELARSPGGNALASLLARGEPTVAARAALALGRTGKLLAADPLLQHTQASDAAIRSMDIYGLGLLARTLSGQTLSPMLAPLAGPRKSQAARAILNALSDGSDAVRIAALDSTARFALAGDLTANQAETAVDRMTHMLRSAEFPSVRARAAYTLASFAKISRVRGKAVHALTAAFATEDDGMVRWHEMAALADGFAKDLDTSTLSKALSDNAIVQIQALHAIAKRKDASWISKVQPLTHDPDWRVNEEARETVTILRGGKRSTALTRIPADVPTPSPAPKAVPPALPRPKNSGKLAAPTPSEVRLQPHLVASTIAGITGPAPGLHPRVAIATTKGTMVFVLYPEWAPSTVANFLNLANHGFYDGLRWLRIVPDFVVQTGDAKLALHPRKNPKYTIPAEENPLEQDAGIISMALAYDKNGAVRDSAGTEFYITISPQPHLNLFFTVFGKIESGADVLGRLVESDRILRIDQLHDEYLSG
jgi:peptidyl-prolyl cis-trans isomerase B (cyclophilin B)